MNPIPAKITSVLISGTLALSATLLLGWPSEVTAVGNEEQAVKDQSELAERKAAPQNVALAKDESKVGDLEVTATLTEGDAKQGLRIVHVECHNPTASKISGKVELALTRTRGSGMERVMPTPQVAWRHQVTVTVEPDQTWVRDVPLPKGIGAEVARIDKARAEAQQSDDKPSPRTFYGVTAVAIEPQTPKNAAVMALRSPNRKAVAGPLRPPFPLGASSGVEFGY